jgi:hypothetical protein
VRVKVAIVWGEHEASAQLKGIPAKLVHVLAMAALLGLPAGGHVIRAKDMEQVADPQFGNTISNAFFIDEQRKRDAGLLPEEVAIVLVAQPDGGNSCSFMAEFRLVLAQLRGVLAAEDSAIVPQKDHNRRRFGPDRSQPDLIAFRVGQTHVRQPCTQ